MFQNFDDDSSINLVAPRVKALRARLTKLKLDGLIVPREDEYQGEYVPTANERLKYISGFGGSAGPGGPAVLAGSVGPAKRFRSGFINN